MPTQDELQARIDELEKEVATLREQVMFDPLTELYSRRFLTDRLATVEQDERRFLINDFFVIYLDIDHFKAINTKLGHGGGDHVLKGVAQVIRSVVRVNDVAGRWGGEEFLILGRGNGKRVAERLRLAIVRNPIGDSQVTVSCGVARYDRLTDANIDAAVTRADQALARAKRAGRNRVIVAREQPHPNR